MWEGIDKPRKISEIINDPKNKYIDGITQEELLRTKFYEESRYQTEMDMATERGLYFSLFGRTEASSTGFLQKQLKELDGLIIETAEQKEGGKAILNQIFNSFKRLSEKQGCFTCSGERIDDKKN